MFLKVFKIIFLFSACFCNTLASAQGPVTDTTWLPQTGKKYNAYYIEYTQHSDPFIDVKDTGENLVWDYNHKFFDLQWPDNTIIFTDKKSIPVTPKNPDVNLLMSYSQVYVFLIKNKEGLFVTEDFTNASYPYHVIYKKPSIWFKTNLAFRDSFYDTAIYYQHKNYNSQDSTYVGNFISLSKYDGYGTLKVAGLQFNNTIRIRTHEKGTMNRYDEIDSSYSFAEKYEWFNKNTGFKILSYFIWFNVEVKNNVGDTSFGGSHLSLYVPLGYVNIHDPERNPPNKIIVFFTGDKLNIRSEKDYGLCNYSVYDMHGRLQAAGKIDLKDKSWQTTDLKPLPTGVYIVRLQNNTGLNRTFKLVK